MPDIADTPYRNGTSGDASHNDIPLNTRERSAGTILP